MPITAVVDLQLGDCGKGKIVDLLSAEADYVFRWNGGGNAGHHVINDCGEFKLHHIPVGILSGKPSVLGNGMVIDPYELDLEIEKLRSQGVKIDNKNLFISDRAHLIMPWHRLEDAAVEDATGNSVGSTRRGIAYAYADKMRRRGLRLADFENSQITDKLPFIYARMELELERIRKTYGGYDYPNGLYGSALLYVTSIYRLLDYLSKTEELLGTALKSGAHLLGEGAQGFHLDIDFGRYPFVSSSSAWAGGIFSGAGIPPIAIPRVIGVAKAYTTYVGGGPFPTELKEEPGPTICEVGKEFGTTTGRRRRVGWFDAPMVRAAVKQNACQEIILMKLDILSDIPALKIATGYDMCGSVRDSLPTVAANHGECRPVYVDVQGWDYPLANAASLSDIKQNAPQALEYAKTIENLAGARVIGISVGPHRDKTFFFEDRK